MRYGKRAIAYMPCGIPEPYIIEKLFRKYLAYDTTAGVICMMKGSMTYFSTQIICREIIFRSNAIAHDSCDEKESVGI